MRELRLSASANADYLACQRRYELAYLYDLTADRDKDSLRVGSTWHACHEVLEHRAGAVCPDCRRHEEIRPDCPVCGGTGYVLPDPMDRVARYLSQAYAAVPDNKLRDEWETERVVLLYSLSGHRWLYAAEEGRWEVIAPEVKFEVPVINPATGRKTPKVVFVGKIDRLVRDRATGLVYVWERKSTSHSIKSEDYWTGLTQGDQISGYLYGGRYAQACGMLKPYGIMPEDPPIQGAVVDVWKKPEIAPKRISKADLKTLAETGEYCGTQISPAGAWIGGPCLSDVTTIETPELFGARLLQDIAERPEFYFQRREVSRTNLELERFQLRLFHLAKQIRMVEKGGLWCQNLQSCQTKWRCEFLSLCQSGVQVTPGRAPTGYRLRHPRAEEMPLG
jgi:hypothetical protein